jgi:anti-sigma factor RsiW
VSCEDVRLRLLDYQRARLAPGARDEVRAHLEGCAACARLDALEHELTAVLELRLPQHSASLALKRRLAARWSAPTAALPWWGRWRAPLVPALAAAVVLMVAPALYYERASRTAGEQAGMVAEAVNDHLRVLASQHRLDIESGGLHEVKPWFEGRLDFAPVVSFEGDAEFPLRGGAVGYFRDRKAAVFVYARRLHLVSLLVFRAEGLQWPTGDLTPIDDVAVFTSVERGFNVIMWRRHALGYALVSDLNAAELRQLAARLVGGGGGARSRDVDGREGQPLV